MSRLELDHYRPHRTAGRQVHDLGGHASPASLRGDDPADKGGETDATALTTPPLPERKPDGAP